MITKGQIAEWRLHLRLWFAGRGRGRGEGTTVMPRANKEIGDGM